MQIGCRGRPSWQNERLQCPEPLIMPVDTTLELFDMFLAYPGYGILRRRVERRGEIRSNREQVGRRRFDLLAQLVGDPVSENDAENGIQFVHRTVGLYSQIALGHPGATEQTGSTVVARFGIYPCCHLLTKYDADLVSYLCHVPSPFNIVFIGDIVGHIGLREVLRQLPTLKERFTPDCIIINGENICDGKGLTEVEAAQLFEAGANAITTGNHIWENWKSRPLLAANPLVLRPFNYPPENPGRGWTTITLPDQRTVGLLQIQGRVYMQPIDCPFKAADMAIARLAPKSKMIVVDFHADATAEKIAMGWYLDGRVSAVLGTHTHVQTNDATILPKGTAYLTDTGMSGPYDSVLGMKKEIALRRFLLQTAHKYETAERDCRVGGVHLVLDEETGKALSIQPFMSPQPRTTVVSTTQ